MTNRTARFALPAAAVTCLALAACGGGKASGTAGKPDDEKFQQAALERAECMRRHGVDVPDPKPGGGLVFNGRDVDPERLERAARECDEELGPLPTPRLSEEDEREFREAALEHARCMREQGIDFPDPTFGPNGRVRLELKDGIPMDDPAFQAADEKCRKHLPGAQAGPFGGGG